MPKGIYTRQDINTRFWNKVKKTESCWIWLGTKNTKRYGSFTNNKKHVLAHRQSYIFVHGIIPNGYYVCHKCDNPSCVNPDHLFLGTPKENTRDMITKNRKPLGENHKSSKLTNNDIYAIRKSKMSQTDIAELYGIDQTQVSNIQNYKQWKHI